MKVLFAVVLVACVVGSLAEVCTVDTDCSTTTCSTGSSVICQHPDGAGVSTDGGLCTCSSSSVECTAKEDCYGNAVSLACPDSQRHCYDNSCICNRFPVGK